MGMLRAGIGLLLGWMFAVPDAQAFQPQITSQPTNQTVVVGSNATFSVAATTSNGLLTYQWYFQSSPIAGATNSTYTRTNVQLTHAGTYRVGVTNTDGGLYSSNAILTVVNPVIAVDNTSRSSTNGSTLSWPHTVGNGTNRILIVGVAIRGSGSTLTAVQYGGENMIRIGQAQNGSANVTVNLYRLLSPAIGTTNVTVAFSSSESVSAGAASFTGVSQTVPLGPVASAGGNGLIGSVNVASQANEVVVDIMGATGDAVSLTPGGGQTAQWNISTGTSGGDVGGASSTKIGAPATTISWTLGVSKVWALVAVSLKPALPELIAVGDSSSTLTNGTTLSWPHSVDTGSNRILMVGLTVNSKNAYTISSATYGGQNLTLVGSKDDGAGKMQVYLYRLLAPPVGTTNVAFTISSANRMVGGAVSFNGVSQTESLGIFASAGGSGSTGSVNVSSATNEVVFDIMGTTGDAITLTAGTNQVQRWSRTTGTTSSDGLGASSTKIGASTVGMTWASAGNKVWVIGAVSLKPALEPDVVTTMTGPANVYAGSNFSYTITVANPGTATASNIVVSDVLPAGLTVVSASGGGNIVASGGLGQVVFDQASSNNASGTLTWPHVTTNAANRLMLVGVSIGNTVNAAVGTMTYGGVSLTKVLSATNSNGKGISELWQLVNPPTGPNALVLTRLGSGTFFAGAATFSGVDPTQPLSATNWAQGKGWVAEVQINSATNEIVFATVASDKNQPPLGYFGQTTLWSLDASQSGAGSIKSGNNFVTSGWFLQDSSKDWAAIAASIKPAGLVGVVTWTIPTLAAGATTNFTLTVTAPLSGTLSNVIASTSTTVDNNPANNNGSAGAAQVVSTVLPLADLVTTVSGLTSIAPLTSYAYTVTVFNPGPTTASGVVVTDTLSPALTYLSSTGGGSYLAGVVTWPAFNLARGASTNLTVTVRSPISGTLTNTASSSSATADPNAANNNGSAPEAQVITAVSPLQVANTSKGAAVQTLNWSHTVDPGSSRILIVGLSIDSTSALVLSATFAGFPTLTLIGQTNSGSTKVLLYRMLNPQVGTYPISISLSTAVGIVGGAVSFNGVNQTTPIAAFAGKAGSGTNASLSVNSALGGVVVDAIAPKSPQYATNAGSAQSEQWNLAGSNFSGAGSTSYGAAIVTPSWELDSAANWAMAAVALNSATVLADVTISVTGPASVMATSNVTYAVTVTNLGNSAASSVAVSHVLPAGATFVSASAGGTTNDGVVTWPTLASLAVNGRTNYTVTIKAPASGTLTNIVYGTSTTADPDPTNNNGTGAGNQVVTTITPVADVATAVSGPAGVLATAQYNYTVTVTNVGPSPAVAVVVSNTLPANVTFVGSSDGGSHNAGIVTWTLGDLASGASVSVTATVTAPTSGSLTNTVASTAASTDLFPANNNGTAAGARVATLLYPVPSLTGQRLPNGHFQMEFDTIPGSTCAIEASTNLVDWITLTTTNAGAGHVIFMDQDTINYPVRFYRTSQSP